MAGKQNKMGIKWRQKNGEMACVCLKGVGEGVVEPVLVANPGVPSEGKYYCRGLVQGDGKGGVKLSRFGRQTIEMMLFSGGGD